MLEIVATQGTKPWILFDTVVSPKISTSKLKQQNPKSFNGFVNGREKQSTHPLNQLFWVSFLAVCASVTGLKLY